MEYKKFPVHLIGLAIAVSAIIAIVLTATGTIFDGNDTSAGSPRSEVRTSPAVARQSTEQMLFLEMNTNLPEISLGSVGDAAAPVINRPAVVSAERMMFLELNVNLPGSVPTPAVRSIDEIRFLEMNELPGDHASSLPFPGSWQSGGSLTDY
jgi:hypothetical protein